MAGGFLSGLTSRTMKMTALIGIAPAVLLGGAGIIAVAGACMVALWFRRFAESRLEAINGDVIGALCELSEAVFLVLATMK
jgi:cobalamin synthase